MKKEKFFKLPKAGLAALLGLIGVILFATLGIRAIGAVLIIADPLKEADAAVALTGDAGDRVSAAVALYKSGYVDTLYITFTDEVTRDSLVSAATSQGFPFDSIQVTKMMVSNTADEARAVRQLAESNNSDSLIVITDPFHTLRTRLIFRQALRDSGIDLQVRPVGGHWYRSNTWWKSNEGIRYTLEEYAKIFLFAFGVDGK